MTGIRRAGPGAFVPDSALSGDRRPPPPRGAAAPRPAPTESGATIVRPIDETATAIRPIDQILSTVQIRGAEAIWVFLAHCYALLVPLAICAAVYQHWQYLLATTFNPFLFFVAACLLSAGGAFEAAQNTMDNWYLTEDSASANGVGLCDFLFYWLVTAGQAVIAIAIGGDNGWVVAIGVASVLALPPLYFTKGPYFAPLAVSNLLVIGLAFRTFGDPVVFLQLLVVAATMYFFAALLKTRDQVLHGFTTVVASSGVWFLILTMSDGAAGLSSSWLLLAAIVVVTVLAGFALWPYLSRLPASRRIVSLGT